MYFFRPAEMGVYLHFAPAQSCQEEIWIKQMRSRGEINRHLYIRMDYVSAVRK